MRCGDRAELVADDIVLDGMGGWCARTLCVIVYRVSSLPPLSLIVHIDDEDDLE